MTKSTAAERILSDLSVVESERSQRLSVKGLGARVVALKRYQQRRFAHTYADLLQHPRYAAASRFFLEELYGPDDFTQRDAQFARVVPGLVRLFPSEIVETVAALAKLHALSETLDTTMSSMLGSVEIDKAEYVRAWQVTGRRQDREAQIELTLDVAERLDRFTARKVMRNTLRLMRAPARAAGLIELQRFLESGFDTFREMRGAGEFMDIVRSRERNITSTLFGANLAALRGPESERAFDILPV